MSSNLPEESLAPSFSSPPKMKPRLALTRLMKKPNAYVKLLNGEYSEWAFNEERAPLMRGVWRRDAFHADESSPLDLEIGTGNGYHFAHLAQTHKNRSVIGIELKFKPLIQSIRRARAGGGKNAIILRYDAARLEHLFTEGELNNVYIHFPDPWSKKRQWKHRLIQSDFLDLVYSLMRPGSFLDFKTDSVDYFDWAIERFRVSKFKVTRETRDLHHSDWKGENFETQFEKIFLAQGMPIHYARLEKI